MSSFWDQLAAAAASGQSFHVTLKKEWEIPIETDSRLTKAIALPMSYDNSQYMGSTGRRRRPRCWNKGCYNHLRTYQRIACSDECEIALTTLACKIIALSKYGLDRIDSPSGFGEKHIRWTLDQISIDTKMKAREVKHAPNDNPRNPGLPH